jgi:diguanylate cyclase (GGDEF)-like protein
VAGPSFYRYRMGQLLRRERELSELVGERTEALRLANLALVEKNQQLAELSTVDALTGLANRRRFDSVLSEEWRRAARAESWISLVMADVDAFKQYNDTLGHPAGDVCLRAIGEVLSKSARRAGELVARIGGEEFCLVLPGAPPDNMMALAQSLCDRIQAMALPHPSSPVAPVVTVSVGGTSARGDASVDAEALLRAADAALYEAKQSGRNRVVTRIIEKASDLK